MSEAALLPFFEEPASEPEEEARPDVQEVVRGFATALRTHLLYEGSSPALDRFVEALRDRLVQLWDRLPALTVVIDEREIRWRGHVVFRDEDREGLAFLLYRDGVRELSFFAGFERVDLDAFLALLARTHRLRSDAEDLLTLLWEHDWEHLHYRYVEPLADGVELPAASGARPERVEPAAQEAAAAAGVVSTDDFREALYFLDEAEMRRLDGELRREMARDLWSDVLNALFDRLEDGAAERQARIVSIVADVLPTLLGAGKLDLAAYALGELIGVATSGRNLSPGTVRALRELFEQLGQTDTVAELVRVVEDAGDALPRGALSQLLSYFPPAALAPLLRARESAQQEPVRLALLDAAQRLAAANPAHVLQLLCDSDARVAAGAARVAGRTGIGEAGPHIARLLSRPEPALRLAAVEALQALRSASAAGALDGALDDSDREVRVAAAKALWEMRYAPAIPRLEMALDSKRLREADLTERIAFFEAYGGLAGPEGVPLLTRILNGRSWLGRKETPEVRACAALGLGRIRHPAAEKALAAAAADSDPVVRSAVGRALRAFRP